MIATVLSNNWEPFLFFVFKLVLKGGLLGRKLEPSSWFAQMARSVFIAFLSLTIAGEAAIARCSFRDHPIPCNHRGKAADGIYGCKC